MGPPGTTNWSGLTGIPSGFADGIDDNTTYSAGPGLVLGGGVFSIGPDAIGAFELDRDSGSLTEITAGLLNESVGRIVVSGATTSNVFQVLKGTDVGPAGGGFLTVGELSAGNISIDDNEIMARSNGSTATLNLNVEGGNVIMGADGVTGQVGIGENAPSDRLHVAAVVGESAFRVQSGGATRLRVNANGGVSIGANNTSVPAGDAYVAGDLGIGIAVPDQPLHIGVGEESDRGLLIAEAATGNPSMKLSTRRLEADSNFTFDNPFDFTFRQFDFFAFADRAILMDAASSIELDAGLRVDLDAGTELEIATPFFDLNSTNLIEIDATNNVNIDSASGLVNIENTNFQGTLVGIGTAPASFNLSVNGSAAKVGGGLWAVFSDERLKKGIEPMAPVLDHLLELEAVSFEFRDPDHMSYAPGRHRGWIAQQVQAVFPEWVEQDSDGYLYLNPVGYESMVVQAIKELRAEKDADDAHSAARIERLEAENAALRERLEKIETLLGAAASVDRGARTTGEGVE